MVSIHQKDVQAFEDEAKANGGPASALAEKQLPVLRKHLALAQDIEAKTPKTGGVAPTARNDVPTMEDPDQWRASKLAGVAIYGPNSHKVGNVTDVLVDREGQADYVIIGVGGFLGIGEKDVAIPYTAVKFTDQPAPKAGGSADAPNGATAGMGTPPAPQAPANGNRRAAAYPDHGVIDMTADQLKSAPAFHFAG